MVASQEEHLPHHWVPHRQDLRTKNGPLVDGADQPPRHRMRRQHGNRSPKVEGVHHGVQVLEGRLTGTIGKEVHGEKSSRTEIKGGMFIRKPRVLHAFARCTSHQSRPTERR